MSKIINVVVVVVAEDQYWEQLEISNHGKVRTVAGGQERFQSVLNGLEWLRQAAADDFAHAGKVGRNSDRFLCAAIAQAQCDHLIKDQDDAMSFAGLAQC